jgi:hypothetical protein
VSADSVTRPVTASPPTVRCAELGRRHKAHTVTGVISGSLRVVVVVVVPSRVARLGSSDGPHPGHPLVKRVKDVREAFTDLSPVAELREFFCVADVVEIHFTATTDKLTRKVHVGVIVTAAEIAILVFSERSVNCSAHALHKSAVPVRHGAARNARNGRKNDDVRDGMLKYHLRLLFF